MTDPITDMFNRIRNAQAVFYQTVVIPFSNLKYQIAKTLEKEGFVGAVEKKGKGAQKIIQISLKYKKEPSASGGEKNAEPFIFGVKRISKPGQRIYRDYRSLRPVRDGYGITIISTSKGIMTNKEARKNKLGGEVICEVW